MGTRFSSKLVEYTGRIFLAWFDDKYIMIFFVLKELLFYVSESIYCTNICMYACVFFTKVSAESDMITRKISHPRFLFQKKQSPGQNVATVCYCP